MADAYGSGPYERKLMQVQVLLSAPLKSSIYRAFFFLPNGIPMLSLCKLLHKSYANAYAEKTTVAGEPPHGCLFLYIDVSAYLRLDIGQCVIFEVSVHIERDI